MNRKSIMCSRKSDKSCFSEFLNFSDGTNQTNIVFCYLTSGSGMVILHPTQKKLRDHQNRRTNKKNGFKSVAARRFKVGVPEADLSFQAFLPILITKSTHFRFS